MSRPTAAHHPYVNHSVRPAELASEYLATATTSTVERLWGPDDVAAYLGIPVKTLYQWRWRSEGPPVRKVGRHLRYEPAEVRQWFANLELEVA